MRLTTAMTRAAPMITRARINDDLSRDVQALRSDQKEHGAGQRMGHFCSAQNGAHGTQRQAL